MAEIAVSFLLDQLTPFLLDEASLLGGVREEVQQIRDELEHMRAFLRVAESKEEIDPQLQVWVEQVREVAHDTEDVLDEFMLRLAHRQGSGFYGFLHKTAFSIKNLKARHRVASEIKRIKSRVDTISKSYERYRSIDQGPSSVIRSNNWHDARGDALLIDEAELVGIDKPKQQLISWLLDGDSGLRVVSVVGMGGLGKTTLAKKVFEDGQVTRHFQSHAWINFSQSFDIVELLKRMKKELEVLTEEEEKKKKLEVPPIKEPVDVDQLKESINELKEAIKQLLQGKRYVIVLDDVWTINAWDDIKCVLSNNNCGSRVLLTTRVLDVARASTLESHDHVHEIKPLSNEDSWALFCKKTFKDQSCPQHLEEISRNIIRKCEGLPLAIVAVGGMLALKNRSIIDEWEMVQRNLSAEHKGKEDKIERMIKILSLSYYDLPSHLKICFLYLSIFPEDFEIKKSKVIRLWIAERFVQERQRLTLEEVAGGYFNELLNRSLIQVVQTTIEGRPKACRIHDLLREIILSKSREQNIVTLASEPDVILPEKVRRLVIHDPLQDGQESKCFHRLRAMLLFVDKFSSASSLALFLRRGPKLLKVLDLTNAMLLTFPDEVCELLHLRFLSMRNTWVAVIPKSIGKLRNLETLDLIDTQVVELPAEIGKLRKLRRLLLWRKYMGGEWGFKTLAEIGNLSSLQKLFIIEANQSLVEKVGNLTQLRSLGITKLRREDGRALCSSLEKLINLRTLLVQSGQRDEIIDLMSLTSPPLFLQKLILSGRLEELPHWIASLQRLVKVGIWDSGLMDSQLQCLQDLPNLLELGLYRDYDGETLCFMAGKFRRLKRLILYGMEKLTRATVEHGAMPNLVELSIRYCDNLEELPSGIEHLTNLQSLVLGGTTSSWVHTLQNQDKESDDWRKIAHIPEVQIW